MTSKKIRKKKERIPPEAQRFLERARQSQVKKHHLVPRFYLERWAHDGVLRVTEVNSRKSYKSPPLKAARETDFYRVEAEGIDPNDVPPLIFETLLSDIEDGAAEAIRDIIDNGSGLTDHSAASLATFMAFQATRGRAHRLNIGKMTTDSYRLIFSHWEDEDIRNALRSEGKEPTDHEMAEARQWIDDLVGGEYVVEPQRATLVGNAGSVAFEMVPYFLERSWFLYQGSGNLITCDEPVVPVGGPPYTRKDPLGVANAGVVIFALSPKHLLAMFHPALSLTDLSKRPELSDEEEEQINLEIASRASRLLFERPSTNQSGLLSLPLLPRGPFLTGPRSLIDAGEIFWVRNINRWTLSSNAPSWPVKRWWYGTDLAWRVLAESWVQTSRAFAAGETTFRLKHPLPDTSAPE